MSPESSVSLESPIIYIIYRANGNKCCVLGTLVTGSCRKKGRYRAEVHSQGLSLSIYLSIALTHSLAQGSEDGTFHPFNGLYVCGPEANSQRPAHCRCVQCVSPSYTLITKLLLMLSPKHTCSNYLKVLAPLLLLISKQ